MAAGLVGDFRESTARGRQAFQHVHDIGHRHSDSFANLIMALSLDLRREQHEANERSLASMQVGLEIPFWGSWAKIISGRTLLASSPRDGLARIEEGISDYRKTGAGLAETYFVVVLAQALAANGEIDKALQHLEEGLALTERGGERFYEAELLRWKGELLLKKGADEADAETCFQTAMAVAEKQGAKLFELRAALGLFQLASLPERIGERRARVASILARMDNGARTPDVIDAERLLGIG
jgi:tetratricopeptide (TPR) repeat protein